MTPSESANANKDFISSVDIKSELVPDTIEMIFGENEPHKSSENATALKSDLKHDSVIPTKDTSVLFLTNATNMVRRLKNFLDPPSTRLTLRALLRKKSENTTKLKSDVNDEAAVHIEDKRNPTTGVHSESSSAHNNYTRDTSMTPSESTIKKNESISSIYIKSELVPNTIEMIFGENEPHKRSGNATALKSDLKHDLVIPTKDTSVPVLAKVTNMVPRLKKYFDPPYTRLTLRALQLKESENTTKLKSNVNDEAAVHIEDKRNPGTGVHSESSSAHNYSTRDKSMPPSESAITNNEFTSSVYIKSELVPNTIEMIIGKNEPPER
jgi:hypothetical protein